MDYRDLPPAVVGLCGTAGSGKDTVAGFLVKLHGWRRLAFADLLKQAVLELNPTLGTEMFVGHPHRLADEVELNGWDAAKQVRGVRDLLQRLGVAMRNVDTNVWVRPVLEQAARETRPVVITDVRFDNEVEAVRALGGYVVRVSRPGTAPPNEHESEQLALRPATFFDLTVDNDGDLDDLAREAGRLHVETVVAELEASRGFKYSVGPS